MARTTIRKVNEALPEGIELVKGNGYFYFASEIGVEVDEAFEPAGFWDGSSVYTFHLQNGTVEEWVTWYHEKRTGIYCHVDAPQFRSAE